MLSSIAFGDTAWGRFLGSLFGGHLGYEAIFIIVAIVVLAAVLAGDDPARGWESVTATWDNDLFTRSNTDRHYTNGVHVRLESRPFAAFDEATAPKLFLPVLKALPVSSGAFQRRTLAYSVG
jgi:hypothetical protein